MKNLDLLFLLLFLVLFNHISYTQWKQSLSPVVGSAHCLTANGSNIIAGADSGVYITTDNGVNWAQSNSGLPKSAYALSLAVSGSDIFAGTYLGGVYRSANNGSNWTLMDNGLPASYTIFSLAVSDSNIFAGSDGGGVFLSTNNGSVWNQVNNGLSNSSIRSLAANGSNIFAGTSGGGVFLSTNNGSNWSPIGLNINSFIYALSPFGSDLFAAANSGLYLFSYNGSSWSFEKKNLNPVVAALSVSGSEIFAGTDSFGVFRSHDIGSLWLDANDGLDDNRILSLTIGGTNIYVATVGSGVWKRPLSEVTSISNVVYNLPKDFTLSQNFPNPFNPSTVISYSLPSASNVKLVVYNALGQSIKVLENSYKQPGNYSVSFNPTALPSGIYFYKLETGQFYQIKKMMLIK